MKDKLFRALVLLASSALFASCSTQHGLVSSAPTNSVAITRAGTFSVRAFGAKGDGKTKDTAAFQKALDSCAAAGGGRVVVPNGIYLIGSIVIGTNTTLQLEGRANLMGSPDIEDYPLVRVRWEGEYAQGHRALIYTENTSHVGIVGRGSILGPPLSLSSLRNPRGPALIEFYECTDVLMDGFTTVYQQLWSIHPVLCEKVVARNLTIRTINTNGDGLDIDSCKNVLIERCNIDTGDDAVVFKSGRGASAVKLARPTEDVVVRDCTLVSSLNAGLSFGSELSGGLRNIRVENCILSGRQNGIYLKSRDGRGGFIENVTGENLIIQNSPTFIGINLLNKGIQASDPVSGEVEKWTRLSNIRFNNVRVDNVTDLVLARDVPAARPVDGLSLSNITGTCSRALTLANMTNVTLSAINVTGYRGAFLTRNNVQGTGLEAAK